jgi:hypothetical protein
MQRIVILEITLYTIKKMGIHNGQVMLVIMYPLVILILASRL